MRVSELNSWRPFYNEFYVSMIFCTLQSHMHCNYLVLRSNLGICSCRELTAAIQFRKSKADSEGKIVPFFILILILTCLTNSCKHLQNHALIKSWPKSYYFWLRFPEYSWGISYSYLQMRNSDFYRHSLNYYVKTTPCLYPEDSFMRILRNH